MVVRDHDPRFFVCQNPSRQPLQLSLLRPAKYHWNAKCARARAG
jgi:hypothetical protein